MRKLLLIMAIVLSFGALTAPSALAKPPEGTIPVPPPPGPGDTTPPTITINTPKDGATYNTGRYFYADYSCADEKGGSGLKSCDGTVANDTPGPVANGSSI